VEEKICSLGKFSVGKRKKSLEERRPELVPQGGDDVKKKFGPTVLEE